MKAAMQEHFGVFREEAQMRAGLGKLEGLKAALRRGRACATRAASSIST